MSIVYVGYTLHITDEVKALVKKYTNKFVVNMNPITAIHFQEKQDVMTAWYQKKSKSPTIAYLRGLYVDPRCIVGHFTIDADHVWVILCNSSDIAPINIKKLASQGKLGKEIHVDRMVVPCEAYKYEHTRSCCH